MRDFMVSENLFYPNEFTFNGESYRGQRDTKKNQILIPIANETSPFDIGDKLELKQGDKNRFFEVLDYEVQHSLRVGSKHPFLAVLHVDALDVKTKPSVGNTHINFHGSVTAGGDFQAGSVNSISKEITVEQLQKAIEESNDPEVKGLWQKLLENPTFSSIAASLAQGMIGQ